MSVSKKVLRKMKKVMGVISAIPVLTSCSSQISCAGRTGGKAETHIVIRDKNRAQARYSDKTFGKAETHIVIRGKNRAQARYSDKTLYFSGEGTTIGTSWRILCSLQFVERVIIEDGVKEIEDRAFSDCTSLEKITIPNSVTSIGEEAFSGCRSLKEITIPDVTSIGKEAFCDCAGLETVKFVNSFKKDKVSLRSEDLWSEGCVEVGIKAFAHCVNLNCLDTDGLMLICDGSPLIDASFYNTPLEHKGGIICKAGLDLIREDKIFDLSFHNMPFGKEKGNECPAGHECSAEYRGRIMRGKYIAKP